MGIIKCGFWLALGAGARSFVVHLVFAETVSRSQPHVEQIVGRQRASLSKCSGLQGGGLQGKLGIKEGTSL